MGRIEPTALQKALKDAQHKAEQVALLKQARLQHATDNMQQTTKDAQHKAEQAALLKQAVVYGTLYVASSMLRVAQGRQVSKH